jgi:hypothetical protein
MSLALYFSAGEANLNVEYVLVCLVECDSKMGRGIVLSAVTIFVERTQLHIWSEEFLQNAGIKKK